MSKPAPKRAATEAFAEPDHTSTAGRKRRKRQKHTRQVEKSIQDEASHQETVDAVSESITLAASVTSLQPDEAADNHNAPPEPTAAPTTAQIEAQSLRKPKRRQKKKGKTSSTEKDQMVPDPAMAEQPDQVMLGAHVVSLPVPPLRSEKHKRHKKRAKHAKQPEEHDQPQESGWVLSPPTAGLFIDQDPILAQQDKYLILPTTSRVHIYSTATSLLVHSLDLEVFGTVTSCRLAPSNPSHVLVSTFPGKMVQYDWTTGRRLGVWTCRPGLLRIVAMVAEDNPAKPSRVMTLHTGDYKTNRLLESVLHPASTTARVETVLLQDRPLLPSLMALDGDQTLIACSNDKLLFGQRNGDAEGRTPSSPSYTWREVTAPGVIASIDARSHGEQVTHGRTSTVTDLVLGFENGAILIYDDILSQLRNAEKRRKGADIRSRRLHWHRDVVNAVKWSRDGNYLISGGSETVLVIWQLDTNQKQFLPHLSTSLLNVSISARGALYAVRLADNSVMVLSTADLLPSANVSGMGRLPAVAGQSVAAIDPKRPHHLLTAISADFMDVRNRAPTSSATLLQTFDLSTSYQTGRQALARNLTTALKNGPTGARIREPDVTHLKISHDGQWLVTVDQWSPAESDVDSLMPRSEAAAAQAQLSEICLRFWIWTAESQSWELNTRVDEPHATGPHAVLNVATHPTKSEVATIGADGVLKIWKPMARYRDGVAVQNAAHQPLYTWSCARTGDIEPPMSEYSHAAGGSAALAYSSDGSVLAASWSRPSSAARTVHFIDARRVTVTLSEANLMSPGHGTFTFAGPHLVSLSRDLHIWDTVTMTSTFRMTLRPCYPGRAGLLAVNAYDGSFALALNHTDTTAAHVVVFNTSNPTAGPLYSRRLAHHIAALLPTMKGAGYVIVDSEASIRRLTPRGVAHASASRIPAAAEPAMNGLEDIFGTRLPTQGEDVPVADHQTTKVLPPPPRAVGEKRSLDTVLAALASSKPLLSVAELFARVAGVFARPAAVA